MRRIFNLILEEGGVRQYKKNFRKVIFDIISLHKSLAIPKSLRILIFLIRLDDSYDMFESSYTQNHNLFENKFVKFQEVIVAAVNEEVRISFKEEELIIYVVRNDKNKDKQAAFNNLGDSNTNREICSSCKTADRKFRHLFIKCWIKFSYLKSKKFITKEEKKKKTKIFDFENKLLSNKRKRIEETSFNASASEKNDYLNVNYAFLKKLNFIIHYSNVNPNDFNILDAADDQVINLIVTKALEHSFMAANFVNLLIRVVVDSDCSRYSFANRSMFITYEKIYSRSIKNIEESEMQPQDCDIISLDCVIRRECVTVTLRNILYVLDISVNLLSIDKLLNFDIAIFFYKTECTLIKNDLKLIDTRNRDLFFLNL